MRPSSFLPAVHEETTRLMSHIPKLRSHLDPTPGLHRRAPVGVRKTKAVCPSAFIDLSLEGWEKGTKAGSVLVWSAEVNE